jgi:hypothetical protein
MTKTQSRRRKRRKKANSGQMYDPNGPLGDCARWMAYEPKTPEPTTCMPGTPAKIAIMAARAELGEALWHPDDATEMPEQRPELLAAMVDLAK